ncbi:hypothetical protein CC2G_006620 [Coprinopsis cinerea AmutBmut pab1-1]|nr:hypothetical protein CC2G_006620 [Coprinopsis cinerea AmutBmut pab1-1]
MPNLPLPFFSRLPSSNPTFPRIRIRTLSYDTALPNRELKIKSNTHTPSFNRPPRIQNINTHVPDEEEDLVWRADAECYARFLVREGGRGRFGGGGWRGGVGEGTL